MRGPLALVMALCLVAGAPTIDAQRRASRPSSMPRGMLALRAEYASVLLRSKRYEEAAAEYRGLVGADSANIAYRLGLARALAWGGRHRDAERELRWLASRVPRDRAIADMLRATRASFEPTAREADRWVSEEPAHLPYRLALARALVREGRARRSLRHFDTLLRSSSDAALLREAAGAHSLARDHAGSAALLGRALESASEDTVVRREYARALWASGDRQSALAEYDRLIGASPGAGRFLERGQLHAWMRNHADAERDIVTALELQPTVAGHVALGDLFRWRGEFRKARDAYLHARELSPADRSVTGRLTGLAREERPALASPNGASDEVGWLSAADFFSDNTGFRYSSLGIRRGLAVGRGMLLSVGAEQRRVDDQRPESDRYIYGFSVDAGATRSFRYGRLSARAGAMRHGAVRDILLGSVTAAASWRAWTVALDLSTGPAYPLLSTFESLRPPDGDAVSRSAKPLIAQRRILTAAGWVGPVDVAVVADGTELSDGNERHALHASLRYPLNPRASALYVLSDMRFRERSELYWNPHHYAAHAIGMEYAGRQDRGLTYRVRALTGLARSIEGIVERDATLETQASIVRLRYVMHISGDGELGYRSRRWDMAVGASYGRGRSGGYERVGGSARVRIVP